MNCERAKLQMQGVGGRSLRAKPSVNDEQIRYHLKRNLRTLYSKDPETVILDELGLRHGYSRIDVVVVNGSLHGYEIKSDRDTFRRLARQADTYNSVLDFVTLVTGQRHAGQALAAIPEWWGIQLAEPVRRVGMRFIHVRKPSENPAPDKLSIAKLLWREEALDFLEELGAAAGLQSKPRRLIYSRLAEVADIGCLRERVRIRLKSRKDWRSGAQPLSCGD